ARRRLAQDGVDALEPARRMDRPDERVALHVPERDLGDQRFGETTLVVVLDLRERGDRLREALERGGDLPPRGDALRHELRVTLDDRVDRAAGVEPRPRAHRLDERKAPEVERVRR